MKTIFRYIICFIIYLSALSHHLSAQDYNYQIYTHKNGLQNVSVTTIKENKDGGIVIGTEGSGIIIYDGIEFTNIKDAKENNNHNVSSIDINNNAIYFSSKYRGVYKIENKQIDELYISNSENNFNNVTFFNNNLFYTANNKLYRMDVTSKKKTVIYDFKKDFEVSQIIKTEIGFIYLTSIGNFFYLSNQQKLVNLNTYYNTENEYLKTARFGYYSNGLLHLYETNNKLEIIVLLSSNGVFNSKIKPFTGNEFDSPIIDACFNGVKNCFSLISKRGTIYEITNSSIKPLKRNTSLFNIAAQKITNDYYGNYWIASYITGLVKVSKQPFTKIEYQPELMNDRINFVHYIEKDNTIALSTMDNETFIGNYYSGNFKKYNFKITSTLEVNNQLYFGTNSGLYQYNQNSKELIKNPLLKNENISYIISHNSKIYVAVRKNGLFVFDNQLKQLNHIQQKNYQDAIIYTGQVFGENTIYFGTSQGIYKFDTKKHAFSSIDTKEIGSYCGLSTKDIFGTIWFTLDFGLFGIGQQGNTYQIKNPEILPSYLFYTLNSDRFGNLYLGTNQGINVLKINDEGRVLSHQNYSTNNGFGGYETHMRSSYQTKNYAFVGTLEGLWKINFDYLQNLPVPQKPIITTTSAIDPNNPSNVSFKITSNNPIINNLYYIYRISSNNEKWSPISQQNEIILSDLKNGSYTIEAKVSYDGVHFSDIGSVKLEINQTTFKNNILLYLLIAFVVIINILFFIKSRKNDPYDVLSISDTYAFTKHAPAIIILGLISHVTLRIILPLISKKYDMDIWVSIPMTIFLFTFAILSTKYKRENNFRSLYNVLKWAYVTFIFYGIFNFYISEAHILYAFFIVLVNSLAHIIFDKTKYIILYTSLYLLTMTLAILYTKNIEYDRFTLMIPIIISAILVIFLHIIKQSTYQQLAFVSTIINKSNIIALALNKDGDLKYVSNNISNYIDCKANELVDQPISKLNDFITSDTARKINIKEDFKDGKEILTPMKNLNNDVTWIEWSCKEFAKGVRVLIGQDVTEKLKLQNTYEVLVENAEDLIFQIDMNGNFKFLNEQFNTYLPYNKNSLIDKNIKTIIPEEYHQLTDEFLEDFKTNDKNVSYFELPIYNAIGELEWFGQYITKLYSEESNEITEYLVVGRNITEKLKLDKIIATQQANITSSINYAKKIQINLLPATDKLKGCFSEQMVYYKPKDIVSGDFYWCKQVDDYVIVAVGDGTGHGVPGAFMSILGINLLNSIVLEKNIYDPGRILDELDVRLRQMLHEGHKQRIRDGIEVTICAFNATKGTIDYSCAGSKLVIHDGVSISIRKGDSKHIGDEQNDFTNYVTHHFEISKETTIYMFTDGYYDQFGGFLQKKYSVRRLLELFTQNISLPLAEQREIIDTDFIDWKGDNDQTDDVTVVGLRILPPANMH